MTTLKHITLRLLMATLLLMAFSACQKEVPPRSYTFNATLEQPDGGDQKVHLVDEHWIYWEYDDKISISSNAQGNTPAIAWLNGYGGDFSDYNGVFNTTLVDGSKYFLGLFPYSANNVIIPKGGESSDFTTVQIDVPATQPYRNDITFGRNVIPMVAWYGGSWTEDPYTPYNLDFHSLAGLARIQVFNNTNDVNDLNVKKIRSITFTSAEDQLSGLMTVNDYKKFNPYLSAKASPSSEEKTVIIDIDGGLELKHDSLRSFYLVLPALKKGMDTVHNYTLTMTLRTTDNKVFSTTMRIPIRRNGITFTRAIGITEWKDDASTAIAGLVGNGTAIRPFKIYSRAELIYLRNCFASPREGNKVYVNGQEVTENTYFRIMRSDIVLRPDNWNSGIRNFKGHMSYYGNSASPDRGVHGITNLSNEPLFYSIASGGTVEDLTVKCDSVINYITEEAFSPFCYENNGTIAGCQVTTTGANSITFNGRAIGGSVLAGICGVNKGTIQGCLCTLKGRMGTSQTHFAGICGTNQGTVTGCVTPSPMDIKGADKAGGIVLNNDNTVTDCIFSARYNSTDSTEWGGIVYNNKSSRTVQRCYFSSSAIISSSKTVGGIVNINNGTVNRCWMEGQITGTFVGGIVDSNATGGKVINCFVNDSLLNITLASAAKLHYGGGIVAILHDGSIENCYVTINRMVKTYGDANGFIGNVVGKMKGGTVDHCYACEVSDGANNFYGVKSGGTLSTYCYLLDMTQDGIERVNHSIENNATLLDNLNTNRPTGGETWILPTSRGPRTLPTFGTLVVNTKKRCASTNR